MVKLGIDLGTTTSLAVVYRNGKVEMIPNKFGNILTPSVVSIAEDGSILTGEIAKERLITHPESTIASFKKEMGLTQNLIVGTKHFSPQELSSFVIASMIDDAKNYLEEEIEEVIISVPAYFQDKQRVATKKAGALAGVTVARIINEPSAAALAAYMNDVKEQRFLVFDFGGGTLDISIVECFENMVEIVSVAGDNHLGGDDFNEAIANAFLKEHKIERGNISDADYAILKKNAEKIKIELTTNDSGQMQWIYQGNTLKSNFDSQRIIEDSSIIFSKIKNTISHALRDGGFMASDMDAIICAGGSSKMPAVKAYLKHLFPTVKQIEGNEQEMIVRGLGIVLGIMAREEDVKDYIMTDICPFSLGIETLNEQDPENPFMTPILQRNTALPSSKESRFYTTHDRQSEIAFDILQGENAYAKDNLVLGKVKVAVPAKPRGEEKVDVRFTYDLNGILEVDITIPSTGKKINHVFSSELSEEEIKSAKQKLSRLKHHPKKDAQNILLKERLLAAYAMASPNMKEFLQNMIIRFEQLLEMQEERKIRQFSEYASHVLEQYESVDPFYSETFSEEVEEVE